MRAEEIKNRESFEAWLNARPAAERRTEAFTLAHRSAMRTLPFVHRSVHSISDSDNKLITQVFFCNVVARVAARNGFLPSETAIVFDSRMADLEARAREEVRERYSEYSRAESDFESHRRISSSSVALAGAVAAARAAIHGNAFDAASAFDGVEFFDAFRIVWDETILDAKNLEKGQSHLELLATPILRQVPSWWTEILGNFSLYLDKLPMSQGGLPALLDWYKDVSSGKPIFGLRDTTIRNTLERNIALGSTDGKFNKEFWERDPPEINADIARWVVEARQADALAGSQRVGLKFKFQQGLIRLFPFYGLLAEGSNEARIRSQLPILRELVGGLKKKVGQLTADDDPLLDALTGLLSAISCEPEHIDASTLFTRTAVLRYHIEEANKDSGRLGVNRYVLSGGDMASAKGIALASDLVVLATKEGQELFDDADRAHLDAGQIDVLREVERKLLTLLTSDGSLMDKESQTLLKQLFDVQPTSPHPKRVFQAATSSLQNAALVSVAVALGGTGLLTLTLSPILAIAIGGVFGLYKAAEMVTKGTPFGDTLDELRKEKVISFGKLLLDHEADIRGAAADRPSWKPVLDLLDRLKDESKPKPK